MRFTLKTRNRRRPLPPFAPALRPARPRIVRGPRVRPNDGTGYLIKMPSPIPLLKPTPSCTYTNDDDDVLLRAAALLLLLFLLLRRANRGRAAGRACGGPGGRDASSGTRGRRVLRMPGGGRDVGKKKKKFVSCYAISNVLRVG